MSTEQKTPLTPVLSEREMEVLKLVAAGLTNDQIARELTISRNTVKVHLVNIYAKLGVQSRIEATLFAVRHRWVEVQPSDAVEPSEAPAENTIALTPPAPLPASEVRAAPAVEATPTESAALPEAEAQPIPAAPVARKALSLSRRVLVPVGIAALLLAIAAVFLRDWFAPPPPAATAAPVAPARWHLRAPLATPREAIAVASVDGLIYAIGGLADGKTLDEVSVYDPVNDKWSRKASKPTPLQANGAAVIGGRIYVPGGCDAQDQPADVMEVYDPASDTWQKGASLPKAICHYALTHFEGKLYLFGGWDGHNILADVFAFDPVRNEWSEQAGLPEARADAAAVVANDHIYVVGGRATDRLLADVLIFDPAQERSSGKAWSAKASLLHPRAQMGLVALAGNLYAMGGGWSGALAENERYDTQADRWVALESAPEALRRVGGAIALETKLYLLGGANEKPTASVQEYTALYRFFIPDVSPPR